MTCVNPTGLTRALHKLLLVSILGAASVPWSLAHALVDIKACENALSSAKRQARSGDFRSHLMVSKNVTARPVASSLFYSIGGKVIDEKRLELPRAKTINDSLGLVDGRSPVYFVEVAISSANRKVDSRGDITDTLYHYLLAAGYIAVSRPSKDARDVESFTHDIYDHAEGYLRLSESPDWKPALAILREAIFVESHTNLPSLQLEAAKFRIEIAEIIHLRGGQLNTAGQHGLDSQKILAEFAREIRDTQRRWAQVKPYYSALFDEVNSPWWQKLLENIRRRMGLF